MTTTITISSSPPAQEKALQHAMLRLEAALLAPVVSGELRPWTETVRESLMSFGPTWIEYVNGVVHLQYKQIAKTDANLLSRVDQMIQEDRQLLTDFAQFENNVKDLAVRASQVQKNEGKAADNRLQVEAGRNGADSAHQKAAGCGNNLAQRGKLSRLGNRRLRHSACAELPPHLRCENNSRLTFEADRRVQKTATPVYDHPGVWPGWARTWNCSR